MGTQHLAIHATGNWTNHMDHHEANPLIGVGRPARTSPHQPSQRVVATPALPT